MAQYQVYFDTLEGEKKYDADIGDEEPIELALEAILAELTERGHVMRGLSTGDLKVIWVGGGEGRELDLSRTLPEQGVLPGDVLRVLVEIYEGGAQSLRADRLDKEWSLLERLAKANPERVRILDRAPTPSHDIFRVRLQRSPGIEFAQERRIDQRDTHTLRLSFPRFFPDVPIECYIEEPLFHPNVKPETGFVCLWEQASPRDTSIQALARAQAMAAYRMVNLGGAHLMNREAGAWYQTFGQKLGLVPLTWEELRVFEVRNGQMVWLEPGRQIAGRPASRVR